MRRPAMNYLHRCRAALMALIASWLLLPSAAPASPSTGVAATVNGVAITMAELDDALRVAKAFSPTDLSETDLRKKTVRHLMQRAAAIQEGTRRGFGASLAEVDAQIASLQARFETRAQMDDALKQNGITEATLQHQVEKDIIVFKLIQDEVIPQIHVTDDDARYYYDSNPQYFMVPEKVRVRHILLRVPENAGSDEKKEIRTQLLHIKDLLNGGADFAAVAAAHSEDTSAENGGDIGFFARDDVAKSFADASFILSPGQISDVVASPLGYHLIQQIAKTPETVTPFEDIRLPLKRYLHRTATALMTTVYLDRLLSASEIKQFVK